MTRSGGGRFRSWQPVAHQTFERRGAAILQPETCFPSFEFVGADTATGADATPIGSFTMGGEPSGTYYMVASICQRDTWNTSLSGAQSVASHPGCTTVADWGESALFGLYQPGHVSLLKPNLPNATAAITMTPPPFVDFMSSAGIVYDYVISVVRITNAADFPTVSYPTEGWDDWIRLFGLQGGYELTDSNTTTSQADAAPFPTWVDHGVCLWIHSRCAVSGFSLPTTFTSAVDLDGDLDANEIAQATIPGPYPSFLDGSFTPDRECGPEGDTPFTAGMTATTNFNGRTKLLTSLGAIIKGRN